MGDTIHISFDDIEIISPEGYSADIDGYFSSAPDIVKPLCTSAKKSLKKIEKMLYSTPAFIDFVSASIPKETFQTILTDKQRSQLAHGTLELMTKKDGSLLAKIINPITKKVEANIPIEKVRLTPDLSQAVVNYTMQMQMALIAEQIQAIQEAVEEVRKGQEYDRLSTAYSCQQKLLQAMAIRDSELKSRALLRIVFDAEDSRNLLMQSQNANVAFIKDQPETFLKKIRAGAKHKKIEERINEVRENLCAVNMVSLAEAMAYQELGETEAAQLSLQYYARYIKETYLDSEGFVERLDMIDPSPQHYWSKTLPNIERHIQALPCNIDSTFIGDNENESEKM